MLLPFSPSVDCLDNPTINYNNMLAVQLQTLIWGNDGKMIVRQAKRGRE